MHTTKITKRLIAVALAMVMIVASLPLLSGRLFKAMASTNITSYEELVDAFAAISEGVYPEDVELVLANDITVPAPVNIHSSGSLDGNGFTISVSNPGTDDADIVNPSPSAYGIFSIETADEFELSNITLKSGAGSAVANRGTGLVTLDGVTISNASTNGVSVLENVLNAQMIIKNSLIKRNCATGPIVNNNGLLVIDATSLNENRTTTSVINNFGKVYINNSTLAGNISTSSFTNTGVIANATNASAILLNSTLAGNKSRGVVSSGAMFYAINSILIDNFLYGDELTESDIVLTLASANDAIIDSRYGTMTSQSNVLENATERLDSTDAPVFNNYSGKYPLIYNDVLYLSPLFDELGTDTYLDYSDMADIRIYYDKLTPDDVNVGEFLRVPTAVMGTTQPPKVTKDQVGNRGATPLAGAAPIKAETYYKVTLVDMPNGTVDGLSTLGTVVKAGDSIEITSTPDSGYEFLYLLDITSGYTKRIITKDSTYTLTPDRDMQIGAIFSAEMPLSLSLLLDGTPWSSKTVDLYRFGEKQYSALAYNPTTEKYEGNVYEGEYEVYVDNEDSGYSVVVSATAAPSPVNYSTITYDANGATGTVPASRQVPTGTTVILANKGNLEKDDHTFTGWIKQAGDTVYAPGTNYDVNSQTVFYANWIPNSVVSNITVRLDGTARNDFEVVLENTVTGVEYVATFDGTSYVATIPNGDPLLYNVFIDGKNVGALDCSDLKQATFDFYSVTYHGNGNTDGEADKVERVFKGSTHTLIANPFEKTGHTFAGWNRQENAGGTTKAEGDSVTVTSAIDFYAVWNIDTYTVAFDVDGGDPLSAAEATRLVQYGDPYGPLPTTEKEGHNFVGWQYNNTLVSASTTMLVPNDHALKAVWDAKVYAINVPLAEVVNCSVVPQNGLFTAKHGTNYNFALSPNPGYSDATAVVSYAPADDLDNKTVITPTNGIYTIPNVKEEMTIFISGAEDIQAPSGEIEITTSKWNTFLNTITFGIFFKDTQNVRITATDDGVGVKDVYYHISETELTLNQVGNLLDIDWTPIVNGETFAISPDKDLIVYAKLVDNNGNTSYISSDGVVLDSTPPEIVGVDDGGIYEGTQVVTVTDKHLASVTVDGESVIPKADDTIKVVGKNHLQTIVATDKCGNTTTVTIMVNINKDADDGIVTKEVDVENTLPPITVTPTADDFKDSLLTDDDRDSVDGGEDINILIEIKDEEVVPEGDKQIVYVNMADKKIIEIFDISVYKEYLTRDTRKKLSETPEPIEFVFEIPSEYLTDIPNGVTRTFYLGRVHDDVFSLIPDKDATLGTITADLDKFSTYVLAYKDAEPDEKDVKPIENDEKNPSPTDAPTNVDPTAEVPTDENGEGGGKEVDGGGKMILTGDNAPIFLTAITVTGAGIATLITDKKRRALKAVKKD